ncbi:flippase [uncultured Kriegella sp.]|uniref:flippase n=1 Tax=uncultured Kriegella sp. TaxID=1798910 RepID=UPI0030DC51F8|tara:strand:- start:38841 stop:40151 length:1311 start_codon:yes stop_codon:yes gene_type:complete
MEFFLKKLKLLKLDFNFIKSGSTVLINRLLGILFGYLFLLYVSRVYGAATVGVYTICYTILQVTANLGRCGTDVYMLQKASYLYPAKDSKLKQYFKKSSRIAVIVSLLLTAILVTTSQWVAKTFLDASYTYAILAVAIGILPLALINVYGAVLNGMESFSKFSFSTNTSIYLFSGIFLLSASIFTDQDWIVFYSLSFGVVITLLLGHIWVRNGLKELDYSKTQDSIDESWPKILKQSYPMMLTASILFLVNWTDSLMLGVMKDNESVGLYSVASRIANVLILIPYSLNSVAAPKFAKDFSKGIVQVTALKKVKKMSFLTTLALVIPIVLGGHFILSFFGPEFTDSYYCLVILAMGFLVRNYFGPSTYILQMSNNQDLLWKCILLGLLLNILLNYLLIPTYGIEGAAIASALSIICWYLVAYTLAMKKIKPLIKPRQ